MRRIQVEEELRILTTVSKKLPHGVPSQDAFLYAVLNIDDGIYNVIRCLHQESDGMAPTLRACPLADELEDLAFGKEVPRFGVSVVRSLSLRVQ